MRPLNILYIISFIWPALVGAQDSIAVRSANALAFIDETSWQYYNTAQWSRLITFSDSTIKAGVDFYYLRVRYGVACFEQEKYRDAAKQFEIAYQQDPTDEFTLEYLYYSLLYSERFTEARRLTCSMSNTLLERLNVKSKFDVDLVNMTAGIKHTDSTAFQNPHYSEILLTHFAGRRLLLTHALNTYQQTENRFSVDQYQYYLKASLAHKKGFILQAGVHGWVAKADIWSAEKTIVTSTFVISANNSGQGAQTGTISSQVYTLTQVPKRLYGLAGALNLGKQYRLFSWNTGLGIMDMDTAFQYQGSLSLQLYPLRNNKLVVGATGYLHNVNGRHHINQAWSAFVSYYPCNRFTLYGNVFFNNGPNITESIAGYVANSIDFTRMRSALVLAGGLTQNLWINATLGLEQKHHFTSDYKYMYKVFSIGLRYYPRLKSQP